MKRTFYIGEEITENEIHAAFKDGILKIMIDKPQPKKIEEEKTIIPIEGWRTSFRVQWLPSDTAGGNRFYIDKGQYQSQTVKIPSPFNPLLSC